MPNDFQLDRNGQVELARLIVSEVMRTAGAELELSKTTLRDRDYSQKIDLSLDLKGGFMAIDTNFIGAAVEDVSDSAAQLYIQTDASPGAPKDLLKQNGKRHYGEMNGRAYLSWTAQPGKWLILKLYRKGDYTTGQITSNNSGGVSISDGSTSTTGPVVNLVAGAPAVAILAQNLNRKKGTVQNKTGDVLYLGSDTTVDATTGIELADGASEYWYNTGPLYAFSAVGGTVKIMEQS